MMYVFCLERRPCVDSNDLSFSVYESTILTRLDMVISFIREFVFKTKYGSVSKKKDGLGRTIRGNTYIQIIDNIASCRFLWNHGVSQVLL